ncbi:PA-phosphatase [Flavobacterium psychrophilum]|nr:PA-phosphatase [Flavobacterium psychrophilum]AOE51636.1 PA-phosphatase [Flavobacterium psychrophilum]
MKAKFLLLTMLCTMLLNAQVKTDSIAKDLLGSIADTLHKTNNHHFGFKQLIIPSVLIGYGVVGLESHTLIGLNRQMREEVKEDIDEQTSIDDFSQYAPMVSVYALNAMGIQGKHNFKDRTVIMATSYLIMSSTVLSLKSICKVDRPDGSSKNSFPSGHTATAFAGAEFLWQEYKDKSVWYGIAGYAVATGTGLFRIYNNRHWITDVAAGAGIGILSTKIAYWLQPHISKVLFGKKSTENLKYKTAIAPFYNGNQFGCSVVVQF